MSDIELKLLRIPAILIALTIHELAHGWVALKCGDPTARDAGRLTLNPMSHLDLFGTIMLFFGPFGWAKPVPVNGYNLSDPKRDIVLISAAGPVSNIILAFVFGYIMRFLSVVAPGALANTQFVNFLSLSVMINLGLSFFNLLPIPPLDGSKILMGTLPNRHIPTYMNVSRYVPSIFLGLLVIEWMSPQINILSNILNPLFTPYYKFWTSLIF